MGVCRDAQIYSRRDCDLELHIIHCELVRIRALQSRFSSVSILVLSVLVQHPYPVPKIWNGISRANGTTNGYPCCVYAINSRTPSSSVRCIEG